MIKYDKMFLGGNKAESPYWIFESGGSEKFAALPVDTLNRNMETTFYLICQTNLFDWFLLFAVCSRTIMEISF